jgi:hypothetical protein
MPTKRELQCLAGKALMDEGFRDHLFADPEKAANAEGVSLTDDQIRRLESVDKAAVADLLDRLVDQMAGPDDTVGW